MKPRLIASLIASLFGFASSGALAHDEPQAKKERLGQVLFKTSCSPEAQTKKYPNDVEAKVFHALALNETFDHKDMAPLLKAISILEPLDKKYPEHPGITHYLIHSYDFAPIAKKGVPAANKYAKIAPSAPHAQHMPSHIYSMVGMWKESIASNISAIKVANEYAAKVNLDGALVALPRGYA